MNLTERQMWDMFHAYGRLIAQGRAEQLRCKTCDNKLVTRLSKDNDELHLWCSICNSWLQPGVSTIDKVRTTLEDTGWRVSELSWESSE